MFVHGGGAFDGFRYKNHVSILRNYESDFFLAWWVSTWKVALRVSKKVCGILMKIHTMLVLFFSSPPEMKQRVLVFIAILFFVAVYIWWTKTHILLRWWCTFTVLLIARHFTFKSTNNSNYRYYICHFKKCQIIAFSIPL